MNDFIIVEAISLLVIFVFVLWTLAACLPDQFTESAERLADLSTSSSAEPPATVDPES